MSKRVAKVTEGVGLLTRIRDKKDVARRDTRVQDNETVAGKSEAGEARDTRREVSSGL